jgi:hypothetical protein
MIAWIVGLLFGSKIQTTIVAVLGLGVLVLGATTYFMIRKNGVQKQFIETLQGDMKAVGATLAVARSARDKSNQDLREFQVVGAALTIAQDKEARRWKEIILALKKPLGAGIILAPTPNNNTPVATATAPEVLTDEEQNEIDCLDRLVPGPILDDLFGVRDNPD